MSAAPLTSAVRRLRHAAAEAERDGQPDGELLRAFVERRDPDAFAALVRRHGPMVLGVCRRVLGHAHDAEDAFQAAFLKRPARCGDGRRWATGSTAWPTTRP